MGDTMTEDCFRGVTQSWRDEHALLQHLLAISVGLREWLTVHWCRRRMTVSLATLESEFELHCGFLFKALQQHHGEQNCVTFACIEAMRQANATTLVPRYVNDGDDGDERFGREPSVTAHEYVWWIAAKLRGLCGHEFLSPSGEPEPLREQLNIKSDEVRSWNSWEGVDAELEIEYARCLEWLRTNHSESMPVPAVPQSDNKPASVKSGMDWQVAKREAEAHLTHNPWPGLNTLMKIIKCRSKSTFVMARNNSPIMRGKEAEYKEARKVSKPSQLADSQRDGLAGDGDVSEVVGVDELFNRVIAAEQNPLRRNTLENMTPEKRREYVALIERDPDGEGFFDQKSLTGLERKNARSQAVRVQNRDRSTACEGTQLSRPRLSQEDESCLPLPPSPGC